MKAKLLTGLSTILFSTLFLHAQSPAELAGASMSPIPNGPVNTTQAARFLQNTTGTTYVAPNTTVTVTGTFSNQQYTGVGTGTGNPVLMFGGGNNAGGTNVLVLPEFAPMTNVGSGVNGQFSNDAGGTATGIDVATNHAFVMYASIQHWAGLLVPSTSSRVYLGDVTFTFSSPLTNPYLQIVGIGGIRGGLGITTEFDLATPGLSFAKVAGNTALTVTATQINNGAGTPNASCANADEAGCGTVRVIGNNIQSVTLRVYIRGDGGELQWQTAGPTAHAGERWQMAFSVPQTVSLSGNVFNDVNGNTDSTVNGTAINNPSGIQLYANLVDPTDNTVIGSVAVAADGTYSFVGVPANTNVVVELSTNQGTPTNSAPAISLPTGWANTGESPGDATPNGSLNVAVGTTNVTARNFGIEQLPVANNNTAASQVNPGGLASAAVPAGTFTATDASGGTVTSIRITAFPTNATSITINGTLYTAGTFPGGGVTVPTNAAGNPTQAISVDPINGAVTVGIPYVAIDNAGLASSTPATASVPFTTVSLSGNVLNDTNGLTDSTVNGTGTNAGGPLYANLISGGVVIQSVLIPAGGTYSFAGLDAGSYTVQVSTNQGSVGNPAPATALPAGWANTGENVGAGAGNDGTVNGLLPVTITTASITNANFGIEQPPTANNNTTPSQANPGGTVNAPVPATAFTATDPSGGTVSSIRITAFPSNATTITINGITYTSGTFPGGGVTVPTNAAGNPTQPILVDPIDGNVTVGIPYVAIDNAGVASPQATASVPFGGASISGNVFNDLNGLTDSTVNGAGTNAGGPLYANLLDSGGNVVQTVLIPAGGTYSFSGLATGNYTVQISTNQGTVGNPAPATALPAGWVNTGENIGTGAGNDGTVNGLLPVTISSLPVTDANFGIEQPPTANNNTAPSQVNPGGTGQLTVPAATFSGADPAGGTVTSIRITAFPAGIASIVINGVSYTSATFPGGGVTVPTNAAGNPTQPITFDPFDGPRTVNIPYVTVDNAGVSSAPATASIPVSAGTTAGEVSISGRVLDDQGRGNPRARIMVTGQDGVVHTALTNPFGYYQVQGLDVNEIYVVRVAHKRFNYEPRTINLTDDFTGMDFSPQP